MSEEMLMDAEKGKGGKDVFDELSNAVIGAAIEVHRSLGPGFLESIYEEALCVELEHRLLGFERQKIVPVFYRDLLVGEHRLDLLVGNEILVELKAVKEIEAIHFAIVRSYLKALDLRTALVFNFATTPLTIRRIDLSQG
jgi:GxxExxY protein